jgi:hypothetical protein
MELLIGGEVIRLRDQLAFQIEYPFPHIEPIRLWKLGEYISGNFMVGSFSSAIYLRKLREPTVNGSIKSSRIRQINILGWNRCQLIALDRSMSWYELRETKDAQCNSKMNGTHSSPPILSRIVRINTSLNYF